MTEHVIASTESDAQAAEAVEQHHAAMAGALALRSEALLAAASRGDADAAEQTRRQLVGWCETELLPHARAEEQTLYPEARATVAGRPLVEGMLDEHTAIGGLVGELADSASDPVRVAAAARALRVLFDVHLAKENEQVIPLLLSTPGVSLAQLLAGMHQILGETASPDPAESEDSACGGYNCSCGETDGPGYPELDARPIPHAIRHATIFGALESVPTGDGLVLTAAHDPQPLLAQVDQRWPAQFSVEYVERGPQAWRLLFTRSAE